MTRMSAKHDELMCFMVVWNMLESLKVFGILVFNSNL